MSTLRAPNAAARDAYAVVTSEPAAPARQAALARQAAPAPDPWWQRIDPGRAWSQRHAYQRTSRALDLFLLALAAPVALPIGLLCGLLIMLESPDGPILFTQARTGLGGRTFKMLKFRTMVPNAEALKASLQDRNELQWPDFKITDDPRVTRVGRFLRQTSLDELPQLLNILRGDMGFIGPRPTSFSAATYDLWHTDRLDVRPGLTGLWQVVGRGSMEFDERVRLDIAYIRRRCMRLDLWILFQTVLVVVQRRGGK